jgi:signal transduction histidine kinase
MAKMSHELRTPLNSIIGFSEVLLDDTMAPQDRVTYYEFLQYIHTSTKHLLNLIDGILDLSKVESGKTIVEPGDFNLLCLLEDVRMTVLPMLTVKKQTLNIKIDENVLVIYADEAKIKQVFLNLISNAHKFTPEDGTISVTCTMEKPHLIYCSVIDNGIGISPQDHQKIFEEFGQAEGSTGAGHHGAGLGLAIARRLVELHGGAIWLTSKTGRGSNFTFSIPVIHREDR